MLAILICLLITVASTAVIGRLHITYPVYNADRQELCHTVASHVLEHTVWCY